MKDEIDITLSVILENAASEYSVIIENISKKYGLSIDLAIIAAEKAVSELKDKKMKLYASALLKTEKERKDIAKNANNQGNGGDWA